MAYNGETGSVAIGYEAMRYADSTGTGALTYNTAQGTKRYT